MSANAVAEVLPVPAPAALESELELERENLALALGCVHAYEDEPFLRELYATGSEKVFSRYFEEEVSGTQAFGRASPDRSRAWLFIRGTDTTTRVLPGYAVAGVHPCAHAGSRFTDGRLLSVRR